jgi:hypothetical protein
MYSDAASKEFRIRDDLIDHPTCASPQLFFSLSVLRVPGKDLLFLEDGAVLNASPGPGKPILSDDY